MLLKQSLVDGLNAQVVEDYLARNPRADYEGGDGAE
jgi:hypothetical protein